MSVHGSKAWASVNMRPELTEPDLERGPVVIVKSEKFSQASAPVRVQK
jgi:hypothetical protein